MSFLWLQRLGANLLVTTTVTTLDGAETVKRTRFAFLLGSFLGPLATPYREVLGMTQSR